MSITYGQKEQGRILEAECYTEDHGCRTCSVLIEFRGFHQSFGNICFNEREEEESFVRDLLKTFVVNDIKELIGKRCVVFWVLGSLNDPIDAIGPSEDNIFSVYEWKKRRWPETNHPLVEEIKRLERENERMYRRVTENLQKIKEFKAYKL
jgi:hypothetical protein